jgi:four helix bundle protein
VKINSFQEILAWEKAHKLVIVTYKITDDFPKNEQFCLVPQMRRSAISIAANIAEGFKRKSSKDSDHFYNIAGASLEELKYYFILSKDLGYLNNKQYSDLIDRANEAGKVLNGWQKSQS